MFYFLKWLAVILYVFDFSCLNRGWRQQVWSLLTQTVVAGTSSIFPELGCKTADAWVVGT